MTYTPPSWSPGRFLKTLAYFDVIPFMRCLQRLFQSAPAATAVPSCTAHTILVIGATGGVGQRVVQQLVAARKPVRALVRDRQQGIALGDTIDLVDAAITMPATLTPAVVQGISAVIYCPEPQVQPPAADTPDRSKYDQGDTFELPDVVGDTPAAINYQGLQNLIQAVAAPLRAAQTYEMVLFDFTVMSESEITALWGSLDDVVMGGVSSSQIRHADGAALFTGTVSTANSGGFASVRSRNLEPALTISGYEGVKLRVKGDGQRYKFLLRSDDKWDSLAYSYSFDTQADTWMDVTIPFRELIPVFRAKTVPDAKAIDPGHITSLQLMLSKFEYDGGLNPHFKAGPFALQIQSIRAYGRSPLPQFVLVSGAAMNSIDRSELTLAAEPPSLRLETRPDDSPTWEQRGEDLVRQSGIPYTIIRPGALTEAAGGQPLTLDQGDDRLPGAVSREDVAALCIHALASPQASNVTFNVKAAVGDRTVDWAQLFVSLQPDQ